MILDQVANITVNKIKWKKKKKKTQRKAVGYCIKRKVKQYIHGIC